MQLATTAAITPSFADFYQGDDDTYPYFWQSPGSSRGYGPPIWGGSARASLSPHHKTRMGRHKHMLNARRAIRPDADCLQSHLLLEESVVRASSLQTFTISLDTFMALSGGVLDCLNRYERRRWLHLEYLCYCCVLLLARYRSCVIST